MKSTVRHHFPRFIVEQDNKWLYNPILRKRYKNLPEERVRLKWVEYLLNEAGWKKSRIAFELPVSIRRESVRGRADLLLYNDKMEPQILIECKAETVPLNVAAAEQAARYNSIIDAPLIILTNGVDDYYFVFRNGQPVSINNPFEKKGDIQPGNLAYWAERGFCSNKNHPLLSDWLPNVLNEFWDDSAGDDVRYLAFMESVLPFPMEHYYRLFTTGEDKKLAVTFLGEENAGSYIAAVLNSRGNNTGLLIINL
ncbi:MAG: type I restriction enzyme HsdR N-terminal domain-containing protein, partial [Balneolaceae bacterium]